MTQTDQRSFLKRHLFALTIMLILTTSMIVPGIVQLAPREPPMVQPDPIPEPIAWSPPVLPTAAGEPTFTRESYPFILNNYPDFSWKNPGQFDSGTESQMSSGIMGFNAGESAPGTGAEAYPAIYDALFGLNESNIRICYLDANYEWISVPYQIDNKGWVNIWNLADLNKWGGLDTGHIGTYGPGSEHTAADPTVGLGWIGGDMVTSMRADLAGDGRGADYGGQSNDLLWDWYRIPTWTYVTPGSSEMLIIDPEYRDQLVYQYLDNANQYHDGWMQGPATDGSDTNYWDRQNSATDPEYDRVSTNNAHPAFVNTTAWADPTAGPTSNMIFMGDTWFTTPGDYATTATGQTMPTWVRNAFPYTQVDGGVDNDDEIVFYVYPGRQAPTYLWYQYANFPYRFELQIVDPIDGGQSWMYIYFNNETQLTGEPEFTTPIQDYVSWNPDSNSINSDFYQISVNETNPSLLDSLRLLGETDGQTILNQFNKMYIYGHIEDQLVNEFSGSIAFGREGRWYDPQPSATPHSKSELVCSLDNPNVLYPGITGDTGVTTSYTSPSGGGATITGDRSAVQTPYGYYGACGSRPPTGDGTPLEGAGLSPSLELWEGYGDGRAMIDGPARVIFYLSQFLIVGMYVYIYVSTDTIIDDYVDIIFPLMDGPSIYYRRMQIQPEMTVEIPALEGFLIQVYYAYILCGTINPDIRADFTMYAGMEWSGANDGTDQNAPTFDWANQYGWTKLGGLDPTTSTYSLLANSYPDGVTNDYYSSGGYPLRETDPVSDPSVCPPDGNNLNLPDWAMLASETHGGLWLFIPRREVFEMKDNGGGVGATAQPKMYFRDDTSSNVAEFGVAVDGGASPWIQGGSKTSPMRIMIVYGDFKPGDQAEGHRMYLNYWFPVEGISTYNIESPPPQFIYDTVQPNKLIYKTGDTISVNIEGWPDTDATYTTTITADFSEVESGASSVAVSDAGSQFWTVSQAITSPPAGGYERDITFTAHVDTSPIWPVDSVYQLTITLDDTPPDNPASLAALSSPTAEASVLLDWSADPGNDTGSASMANPSGLSKYKIYRSTTSGQPYETVVANNIPITQTNFVDSFVVNGATYYYIIETYDVAGNRVNSSSQVFTTIDLPFIPAQPDDLPATINPSLNPLIIDWTANPGNPQATITGYRVWRSTTLGGVYTDESGLLGSGARSWTDSGPFTEAAYYYYKVESESAGSDILSSAVSTRIDRIKPAPAELATPLPLYQAENQEIIVSWAVETLPQYQSGGFPGQDLNGIAYWEVWKQANGGGWSVLGTVPYGSTTLDQRILDTAVSDSSTYDYNLRTYDAAGNWEVAPYPITTTLDVVGPGKVECFSVTAGTGEVTQGDVLIPITVVARNPGATSATLNQLELIFTQDPLDVSSEYTGIVKTMSDVFTAGTSQSYTFYVNVSQTAHLGTIEITGKTTYDTSKTITGAYTEDSWVVKPDADLNVLTVSSSYTIVHPGEANIPVNVDVRNPGSSPAQLDDVQLIFKRSGVDISNKFMVEYVNPASMPRTITAQTTTVNLKVTVSVSITEGPVTIDAICSGSSGGIPLSDDDGAVTTDSWGVQTWPKPVIVSVEADQEVYWSPDPIQLTVTCDTSGHSPVRANFDPVESGAGWVNGVDQLDGTYIISFSLTSPSGEGTFIVTVEATNASGTTSTTTPIRLGQAPTLTGLLQSPTQGFIQPTSIVDIDVEIDDNGGAANVQAVLKYRVDGGNWLSGPLTHASGTHWDGTIPAQPSASTVEFKINATDLAGNWATIGNTYTVNEPPIEPVILTQSVHEPGNPGNVYNETPTYGAPQDTPIAYQIEIDTQYIPVPDNYVVVVSAFNPIRDCFLNVNATVALDNSTNTIVILELIFPAALVPSGTLIYGKVYVLTDLPSNGGSTITWVAFTHLVE